jgi:hypothetical protein
MQQENIWEKFQVPDAPNKDNINIKSGIMTNIISSNIEANDTINIDAGLGLNIIGLPDKIGANEKIDINFGKTENEYQFGIGGNLGLDIDGPNRASITAENGVSGKAEYILGLNSDLDAGGFESHIFPWNTPVISGNILPNGADGDVDFHLNIKYNDDSKLLQINNINIQLPQGVF